MSISTKYYDKETKTVDEFGNIGYLKTVVGKINREATDGLGGGGTKEKKRTKKKNEKKKKRKRRGRRRK